MSNLLVESILEGCLETVQECLNGRYDINGLDDYGFTPLIEAAIIGKCEIVNLLLDHAAEVNKSDLVGRTALHWAADSNNLALSRLLLKRGADANAYSHASQPVLTIPLLRNQNTLKNILMDHGANLKFAQDFILAKLMGHRYELTGFTHIADHQNRLVGVDFEGFFLEFTLAIVHYSLTRYCYHFVARHLREYSYEIKKILQLFSIATELIKYQQYPINFADHEARINLLLQSDPLLIPIAFEGHAITFVKNGNFLIRCDRGEYSKVSGTVVVYEINLPQKFTLDFVKYLIYQKQSAKFINEGINKFLGLTPIIDLPVPSQTIGNCSWANVEASMPALFFMLNWQKYHYRAEVKNELILNAMEVFNGWCQWDREEALRQCLHNFNSPMPKARKISLCETLTAILFQTYDYRKKEDLKNAQKIITILMRPAHQYILKIYSQIYSEYQNNTQANNFKKLLEICGAHFSI